MMKYILDDKSGIAYGKISSEYIQPVFDTLNVFLEQED